MNGLPREEREMAEKLLTIREVAYSLGVSEKEVIELAEHGGLPAYKVGGLYLRFRKDQIEQYKHTLQSVKSHPKVVSSNVERVKDFFYFYDFYILSVIVIIALLVIISRG